MKNNRKKQTSSYLLIFLGIVAALLILIILYLTSSERTARAVLIWQKMIQQQTRLKISLTVKLSDLALVTRLLMMPIRADLFLMMEVPTANLLLMILLSRDLPERKCRSCTAFSSSGGSNCSLSDSCCQCRTSRFFPVIRFRLRSDNRWHFPGKKDSTMLLLPPNFLTMMAPSLPPTEVLLLTTNPMKRWILWSLRSNPSFLVQTVPGAFISVTFQAAQRLRSMIPQCRQPA